MKRLICLVGMPCCGKSYAGRLLSKAFQSVHISTGDIARSLSESAEMWKQTEAQDLFPLDDKLLSVLTESVEKATTDLIFIDGFPRSPMQAKYLLDHYWNYDPIVLEISAGDVSTLVARARARGRDSRDTNEIEFTKRLLLASKHLEETMTVLRRGLVPCYTLMSSSDDFMIKNFKKTIGIK